MKKLPSARIIPGLIILALGVALLLHNFDLVSFGELRKWWPMLVVALGVQWIEQHAGMQRGRWRAGNGQSNNAMFRPSRMVKGAWVDSVMGWLKNGRYALAGPFQGMRAITSATDAVRRCA